MMGENTIGKIHGFFRLALKFTLTAVLTLFLQQLSYSQEGFTVVSNNNNISSDEVNSVLGKCNFDVYRMFDQNRVLHFDNGLTIELESAQEIISRGGFIKVSHIAKDDQPVVYPRTFHVDQNGNVSLIYNNTDPRANKMNQQKEQ